MKQKIKKSYLRKRLEENNDKWMGFKIGKNNEIVVRIRRNNGKHFYLIVDKYIRENKITVRDSLGKEKGVAIRFARNSFCLEPDLKE